MSNVQAIMEKQTPIGDFVRMIISEDIKIDGEPEQSRLCGTVHVITNTNHATVKRNEEGTFSVGKYPLTYGGTAPLMDTIFADPEVSGICVKSEEAQKELRSRGRVRHTRGEYRYHHNNGRVYDIF